MLDRVDEARALSSVAGERFRELVGRSPDLWDQEELAGNHEVAAEQLRVFCDRVAEQGQTSFLGTYGPQLGRILCALGRYDEADRLAGQGHDHAAEDDPLAQSLWRQVAALVAAHRGDYSDAERLGREAVAHTHKTDSPQAQGDAYFDLAQVLEAAGRGEDAAAAWNEALDRYERKGIIPLARRTRERLSALQESPL
jgi:tetratricopeptide (TPR) repeat protein